MNTTKEALPSIVNSLIEKILPWHPVRFTGISGYSVNVLISSSNTPMNAFIRHDGKPCLVLLEEKPSAQDEHLVNHLNGILLGKVRNDAGELVDVKAT